MKKKSCFTLIELLVVITVISILAGILLPTLMKVREKVRLTVCLGNIRQIYVGAMTYANDNDGFGFYVKETNTGMELGMYGINAGSLCLSSNTGLGRCMMKPGYLPWKILQCPAIRGKEDSVRMHKLCGNGEGTYSRYMLNILDYASSFKGNETTANLHMSYTMKKIDLLKSTSWFTDTPIPIGRLGNRPTWAFASDMIRGRGGSYLRALHNMRSADTIGVSFSFNLLFEDGAALQEYTTDRNRFLARDINYWSSTFGRDFARDVDGGTFDYHLIGKNYTYGYWR